MSQTEEPYKSEEWLRRRYEDELLSLKRIADLVGVSKATIYYWMDQHGIERRDEHWWHERHREERVAKAYKGYIPETGHRYPVTGTHECDDPLCPARRD